MTTANGTEDAQRGRRGSLVVEVRSYGDPDVVRLVRQVQAEYVLLYGGPDAAHVDPGEFDAPGGAFLVGTLDGVAVATGGWRRRAEPGSTSRSASQVAEIKRMYVSPAMRRRGYARVMLAALERSAAAAGVTRLVLNTGPEQPAAIAMYESAGYTPAPGFGHYADHPGALFFAKPLGRTGGRTDHRPAS